MSSSVTSKSDASAGESVDSNLQDANCPIESLPYDVKRKLILQMSVKSFRNLSEASKAFRECWNDDTLWKRILQRDFGTDAVREAEREENQSKFKAKYQARFVERKERQRPLWFDQPSPNPPPGVMDPSSYHYPPTAPNQFPGMIGGPQDVNPLGGYPDNPFGVNRYPHPLFPQPPGPRNPYGPRIYPVHPFDPDSGLPGPPPPGRGPRPDFWGPSRPNNPFGGGPSFPRGGFF